MFHIHLIAVTKWEFLSLFQSYITGALSRFLRPEPSNIIGVNAPNSLQDCCGDSESDNCRLTQGASHRGADSEERPLSVVSHPSSHRPLITWEPLTDRDLEPDGENLQHESRLGRSSGRSNACEEAEGAPISPAGSDAAGTRVPKDEITNGSSQDKQVPEKLDTDGEDDDDENETNDVMIENTEDTRGTAGAEEETPDEHQRTAEVMRRVKRKRGGTGSQLEVDNDTRKCHEPSCRSDEEETVERSVTGVGKEENMTTEETRVQAEAATAKTLEEEGGSDGGLHLRPVSEKKFTSDARALNIVNKSLVEIDSIVAGQPGAIPTECERASDDDREDDEEAAADEECAAVVEEEEDVRTTTCREKHRGAMLWIRQEDNEAGVQIKRHDTVITANSTVTSHNSIKGENLARDDNKESSMETACTPTRTLKPQGQNGQEASGELKNSPLGVLGGQLGANPPACKETQEAVPEYNNEPGSDENTQQWFLEVGNYKEMQTPQLPEEVERKEPGSLQNRSSGAACLLGREPLDHDSRLPDKRRKMLHGRLSFPDTQLLIIEPDDQKSRSIFQQETGRSETVSADDTKNLEAAESLMDLDNNWGVHVSEKGRAAEDVSAEPGNKSCLDDEERRRDDLLDAGASSLQEDSAESQWKVVECSAEREKAVCVMERAAEGETLPPSRTTAEVPEENSLIEGSELSTQRTNEPQVTSLGTNISEETKQEVHAPVDSLAREFRHEQTIVSTDKMAKHGSCREGPVSAGGQDAIDEDILDLWTQTALSEDSLGLEPGQQLDPQRGPPTNDQGDIQAVCLQRQRSHSVESQLMGDDEFSSSTAEPGFSDHSFGEAQIAQDHLDVLEIRHADSRCGTEVLLTLGMMSKDSGSQTECSLLSEKDSVEKLPVGRSSKTAEQPRTKSEDGTEVLPPKNITVNLLSFFRECGCTSVPLSCCLTLRVICLPPLG